MKKTINRIRKFQLKKLKEIVKSIHNYKSSYAATNIISQCQNKHIGNILFEYSKTQSNK